MNQHKDVHIPCECGCSIVRLQDLDDWGYSITFLVDTFSSGQQHSRSLWNRLKLAWYAIRGKEYRLHEIIINRSQVQEVINELQKLLENKEV